MIIVADGTSTSPTNCYFALDINPQLLGRRCPGDCPVIHISTLLTLLANQLPSGTNFGSSPIQNHSLLHDIFQGHLETPVNVEIARVPVQSVLGAVTSQAAAGYRDLGKFGNLHQQAIYAPGTEFNWTNDILGLDLSAQESSRIAQVWLPTGVTAENNFLLIFLVDMAATSLDLLLASLQPSSRIFSGTGTGTSNSPFC